MEELEDCPNTVWPTLFCLVGKLIDEDSEMDPDYISSTEESQDSLEYRSESEHEESQDLDSDMEEEYLALVETTKETASNHGDLLQEYLACFKITQLGIRLADSGLAILESPLSLVSDSFSSKVQNVRRHLRFVRRAGAIERNSGQVGKVIDEDSDMDPDYVPSTEESQDSLEYRSETEIEQEESQEVDSDVVRRAGDECAGHPSKMGSVVLEMLAMFRLDILLGVLGMHTKERKVTDEEDSEMDPDYVPSTEESQDSLEYRSETEIEQEESQEVDSDVEELEDCPTTPNCVKVQHKVGKIVSEQLEAGSHVEDELDEEFEISEVECRTPQCVKGEHEGRRFQES
eukprot:GFUD01011273.1.p1 GENE.GFUD01011273.1~~GFUD01011273.1.p1  ORF type:complete len:364 (+),score=131.99 GFUD01011273.1:59-1093(+)